MAEQQSEDDDTSEQAEETVDETTDDNGSPNDADPDTVNEVEDEENSPTTEPDGVSFTIESNTLDEFISYATCLVDECRIDLDPQEGISISASDPANVAMTTPTIQPAACESYSSDGYIGMNIEKFAEIIGMANKGDLVTVDLDQQTQKLHISFDGLSYTMALIDPKSIQEEPDIPDLNLPSEVVVEASQLSRGVSAAEMVSDHIRLATDPEADTFHIEAEGDTDDVDLELDSDDLIDLTAGDANSLFSLDYLKDMLGPMDSDAEVRVQLGDEFPIKLHVEFAEGLGQNTFLLAPRITSE